MMKHASGGFVLIAAGVASAQSGSVGAVTTYADQDAFGTSRTLGSGFTATVQPAGIRAPTSGTRFFNVEGSSYGAFASWGGIQWDLTEAYAELDNLAILSGFSAGEWTIVGVTLQLTQSIASFTTDGPVDVLFTDDDGTANFDPRTAPLNRFTFPSIPLATAPVITYAFVEVATGFVEEHDIGTPEVLEDLNEQGDVKFTLILNPADPTVAATYKGQDSPFNADNAPALVLGYALGPVCYADCDTGTGPGVLDIFDFLCFQNEYAANSAYACDCDTASGQGVCDIFDFLCFQNEFAAGCP